jgi:hypothetical protein
MGKEVKQESGVARTSRNSNLMRRGIKWHETSPRTESSSRSIQGSSSATRECSSSPWNTNCRNAWNRDMMSHHKGRLEAIRAICMVIGKNRHLPETQFFGGQSRNKMKLNRLKMQQGTSRSPEGL